MNNNNNIPSLPNDIILSICKQNRINKQNELYKKRHNLFIKYLDYYIEEHGDTCAVNMCIGDDLRIDYQFLEYEGLWGTSFESRINEKWGEMKVDTFMNNHF